MQESDLYRFAVFFIHRKTSSRPVAGGAYFFKLVQNYVAVFFFPFPNFFYEFFLAQTMPRNSLLLQIFLHHILSGDAGVVCAGYP